jgi:hypothetical protein
VRHRREQQEPQRRRVHALGFFLSLIGVIIVLSAKPAAAPEEVPQQ